MSALKISLWIGAAALILGVCGCDLFLSERRREDPVYVEQRPVYVEPQRTVIVQEAPRPPVVEVRER